MIVSVIFTLLLALVWFPRALNSSLFSNVCAYVCLFGAEQVVDIEFRSNTHQYDKRRRTLLVFLINVQYMYLIFIIKEQ